ncbi:MAG: SAM-dependent methyltransferase [Firmicutes bacterium]|nr:SAM-dependent methyltransferase [Bacillota bacterium]
MKLSERLTAVANMVKPCDCAADIGTDHAYVPIYLCENNIVKRAVAGDVSKGSAQKALDNIIACGYADRIDARCGNGLKIIEKKDNVGCIIIAGMGGMLMRGILENGDISGVTQLVLQPQKDIPAVRRYIHIIGFKIENETMLCEDNKYYNVISAVRGSETYTEKEYELGKILIDGKDKTLKTWLLFEIQKLENLIGLMNGQKLAEAQDKLKMYKEVILCL